MLKLIFKNEKLKIFATLQIKIGRKKKKTREMEKIAISYPTESQIKCLSHKLKKCILSAPKQKWLIKYQGYWILILFLHPVKFFKYLISIKLF